MTKPENATHELICYYRQMNAGHREETNTNRKIIKIIVKYVQKIEHHVIYNHVKFHVIYI